MPTYWIGEKVNYHDQDGYIICDVDRINKLCQIGIPDNNDMIWNRFWVESEEINKLFASINLPSTS